MSSNTYICKEEVWRKFKTSNDQLIVVLGAKVV